jgi:hypothetical protein
LSGVFRLWLVRTGMSPRRIAAGFNHRNANTASAAKEPRLQRQVVISGRILSSKAVARSDDSSQLLAE